MPNVCRIVLFASLAASLSFAQEATKAEPAHYHLMFENEHVQVISIYYGPHEKSRMHTHLPGVVVTLTAGNLKLTDEEDKIRELHSNAGDARWLGGVKHRVENMSDKPYRGVYIYVKSAGSAGVSQLTTHESKQIKAMIAAFGSAGEPSR